MKLKTGLPLVILCGLINSAHAGSDTLYGGGCKGSQGEIVACHLNVAYNNTTTWCGSSESEDRAGSLCSGVLIRGTSLERGEHAAWDIRPQYKGVSFSFLRRDANFGALAYNYQTGFILFPYDHTPAGIQKLVPKCAFPFDGDTVNRQDHCKQDLNFTESNPCYTLTPPVNTSYAYLEHFKKNNVSPTSGKKSCGFMLDEQNARKQFLTFIESRNKVISELGEKENFKAENEVVMPRWNLNNVDTIPIEAFFYLDGSEKGLKTAKSDQNSFYKSSGFKRKVPIIKLTLPKNNNDVAHFTYSPDDQDIK